MKIKILWILILTLILVSSSLFADDASPGRFYPLPIAESEGILSRWLTHAHFEVSQTSLETGKVRLNALRGDEIWQITIESYSPLASYFWAIYARNGQPDQTKLKELWDHLENYSQGLYLERHDTNQMIPAEVLSQSESVVCIIAKGENKPIQFSGFLIDNRKGLIVATAHDLNRIQEIIVILNSGQEIEGNLFKKDSDKDLILIKINSKVYFSSISLTKSRNTLKIGEKVYSIGCPLNHQGKIYSGIFDGQMGRVNNLPLWQIDIETLPGSSGSPVFDVQGNLVGVVKGRYRGDNSRGFVITMETLMEFLRGE